MSVLAAVDLQRQAVALHPAGGVDGVAEQAVAGHLHTNHPGTAGTSSKIKKILLEFSSFSHKNKRRSQMLLIVERKLNFSKQTVYLCGDRS